MSLNKELKTAKSLFSTNQGNSSYVGKVGNDDPKKYYKLRLNRASDVNLSLTGLTSDANLELLNRQGKILGRSTNRGRLNESISQTVGQGTYFVRVSRSKGSTRYQLNLGVNASGTPSVQSSPLIDQVVQLTNNHRQAAGLTPLRLNTNLNASAQSHSADMAVNDFFSHTGSGGSTPFNRMLQAGYDYSFAAENIAVGYGSPESVVQAWMNSPGHRANILNPNLKEIGIGFYFLDNDQGAVNYRYYWTQDFGASA